MSDDIAADPPMWPTPRYHVLDIWMALGGDSADFEAWYDDPGRTPADAWAQLMAAIANNIAGLVADTNPPAGAMLDIAILRRQRRDL